jgi:hypothetical protein
MTTTEFMRDYVYVNCINICITHYSLKNRYEMAHAFNYKVYLTATTFFSFMQPWYKTAAAARNDFVFVVKRSYHGQQMEKTLSFCSFMASTQLNRSNDRYHHPSLVACLSCAHSLSQRVLDKERSLSFLIIETMKCWCNQLFLLFEWE